MWSFLDHNWYTFAISTVSSVGANLDIEVHIRKVDQIIIIYHK